MADPLKCSVAGAPNSLRSDSRHSCSLPSHKRVPQPPIPCRRASRFVGELGAWILSRKASRKERKVFIRQAVPCNKSDSENVRAEALQKLRRRKGRRLGCNFCQLGAGDFQLLVQGGLSFGSFSLPVKENEQDGENAVTAATPKKIGQRGRNELFMRRRRKTEEARSQRAAAALHKKEMLRMSTPERETKTIRIHAGYR